MLQHIQCAYQCHINDLIICAIYCLLRYKVDEKKFTVFFKTLSIRFILEVDCNAKHSFWESRLITTKGCGLFKSTNKIKAQFISTIKPTHWLTDPNKLPDLIGFYVMNGVS